MCEHELRLLSNPIAQINNAGILTNGHIFYIPPIFQCIKCFKVFKTDRDETSLIEIPICELSEEGLKAYEEPKKFYVLPKGEKK